MDNSQRGDLSRNAHYWKRWVVTVSSRVTLPSLGTQVRRRAFLEWFSDGLAAMFADTDNFVVPARMMRPAGATGSNRRYVPIPFRMTPPTATPRSARVRYQVEVGPRNGFVHAHVYIELEARRAWNFRLRQFHKGADNWWWANHWPAGFDAPRNRRVSARGFGWHVKAVRPQDPERDDIMRYISKTLNTPTPRHPTLITADWQTRQRRPQPGRRQGDVVEPLAFNVP